MSGPGRTESANAVVREYSGLADRYDAKWAFYIDATTRETVRRMHLSPSARVLDIGCGTGALLHRLLETYPEADLSGVDPVPRMLAIARRKLPPSVELEEAWAERLPFGEAAFDAVASCSMLHYMPDPETALRETRRVLRPGGRIVITDWCRDFFTCRLLDRCLNRVNRAHAKTYRTDECVALLQRAGLGVESAERYKINWFWGLMTIIGVNPGSAGSGDRRASAQTSSSAERPSI